MSSKKAAVTLTAYEDLFSSEAERQNAGREQVQNVPLELFHPFPNHPFKVLDDEKMQDTVQRDRKSTRLNSSHPSRSRMPSSA